MHITDETIKVISGVLPTCSALYRIKDGAFKALYVSDDLPGLLGMDKEEYDRITKDDAAAIVLPQDKKGLQAVTQDLLKTGKDADYYYRVRSNISGFDWVHVNARICGEMDGDPIVIVRYANMSRESSVFYNIINYSDRKTIVIDCDTHEVLYANAKAREGEDSDGRILPVSRCYSFLKCRTAPCEKCTKMDTDDEELHSRLEFNETAEKWELFTWKRIEWCMRSAVAVYIQDVTREKEHEISLNRLNQIYQMAIEDAREMIWIYDPKEKTITYQTDNPYTKNICEKTGMPAKIGNVPDSLIGMVDEGYKEGFLKMFDVENLGRSGVKYEYSSTVNGDKQWWRVASRPVYDLNRNIKSVFCTGTNITEEKQAMENYRALRVQVEDMSDLGIASFRLNLSGNRFISGHAIYPEQYKMLKKQTADEHFSAVIAEIADEEIRNRFRGKYTCQWFISQYRNGIQQVSLEFPVRSELEKSKGRIRWMKATNYLMTNPDTGDVEDISIVTEITRQKKNEKMLEIMANNACDFMGLIDCAEYSIEFYSGTWDADFVRRDEKIDYSESADGLTATFADGLQRDAFARQIRLQNILEKLEEQNEAIIYYDFTDSEGNILKKQIKYRWFGKEKTEILAVQEDITKAYAQERQRVAQLQEALKRANSASFAKTEFLSRMSHDMRTPLNGILGMSYLAENETDPAVIRDYISKIEASAKFQLGLINDILDMTRVESGKIELHPEPYTIAEFTAYINAVIVPLCEERRQQFIFEPVNMVNDIVPLVDKQHMNQIVFNLLSNAVKYTPEGGTITYQAEERKLSDSRMAIHIDVMDNGIGMSSEFQEVLFEPFTQENRDDVSEMRGSGLGLSIVKKLIEAMGGNISVKSRPGAGTTFSLDLISDCVPADEAVKDAARPDEPEKEGMLTGRHILLCEDHPLNQEIAKGILEGKGAIVSVADNGKLGIDIFENSTIGYFDCILMDIHMPEMNGYETAKMIRRLMRPDAENVPIIAMTADAFEEDVQKCLDAGMNGHVAKPIVPDLLYKALASSFLKKQGTGN